MKLYKALITLEVRKLYKETIQFPIYFKQYLANDNVLNSGSDNLSYL